MAERIIESVDGELRARVPKGLPLLVVLGGTSDAGGVISQLGEYLWERCGMDEILRFDPDLLLDYRSRRPLITFDEDHFTDYEPETLALYLAHDELGAPFLVLHGFEPDFRWGQFIDQILLLVDEFDVSVTTWSHAIPMPVPHTRPIRATVSGTREDLIEARSVWKPTSKLPASLTHVLEYRLQQLGEDVVGFALLVPHYLSNTDFPDALLTSLDGIMAATGLLFATDPVRDANREYLEQVERQISENAESVDMLRGLEARYDAYMEDQTPPSPLVGEDGSLPTADQLASELERFLAQQRDGGAHGSGDSPTPGP
ncbi:MAG: PAC2 family protein [Leucobacter sp.]|nr:PAC2 family protein [Leucobacter sp.]